MSVAVPRAAGMLDIPLPRAPQFPHVRVRRVPLARVRTVLLAAAIFCIPILTFLPFLTTPFMRDEAFYATVAQAMRHGAMPYEYGFDNKPPMIFYWYFASFQVFGENVWAPRLVASLLLSGCAALIYVQARLLFSHRWGLVAAFIFGLSTGIAKFESNANTEYFMIPALVLALVAFTLGQRKGNWYWFALCGAASALAVLTKQTAVFVPLVFVVIIAWPIVRQRTLRDSMPALRALGLLTAGGAAVALAVLVPFAVTGTLDDAYRGAFIYAREYTGNSLLTDKLLAFADSVPRQLVKTAGPWTLLAAAGIVAMVRNPHRETRTLLAWSAASALGVLAAGRFYPHYFVTMLPAMALLAIPALQWLRANWSTTRIAVPAVLAIALLAVWPAITNGRVYLQTNADYRHMQKYDGNPVSEWEVQSRDVGAWIADVTRPGEKIYEFGFMPSVYFYADRMSPTQYTFKHPFAVDERYAIDAVRQLEADKPVIIFDSAAYEDDGEFEYHGATIMSFVKQNYVYAGKLYFGDVWVLRGWEPFKPIETLRPY